MRHALLFAFLALATTIGAQSTKEPKPMDPGSETGITYSHGLTIDFSKGPQVMLYVSDLKRVLIEIRDKDGKLEMQMSPDGTSSVGAPGVEKERRLEVLDNSEPE